MRTLVLIARTTIIGRWLLNLVRIDHVQREQGHYVRGGFLREIPVAWLSCGGLPCVAEAEIA